MAFDWKEKKPLNSLDARITVTAGSNDVDFLLFSLGTSETFGLDVLKVNEVRRTPNITRTPNMPTGMKGIVSLHSKIFPVISLSTFLSQENNDPENSEKTMIVVEYSKRTLGFLVQSVDQIVQVDVDKIRIPENIISSGPGFIMATAGLENGITIALPDVEQILANVFSEAVIVNLPSAGLAEEKGVFFVDDSIVARRKIANVLDKLGTQYKYANNGLEAWSRLQGMATQAQQAGMRMRDVLRFILVDAEMPEMDGYVLTKNIKADPRFVGIPVVMHSSLLSGVNRQKGQDAGVDIYVRKFDAEPLSDTLRPMLEDR